MERDEVVIVECVLRLYPRITQAMKQRGEYIKALMSPSFGSERVTGGNQIAGQDRYLVRLEEDKQYNFLRGIVEPVRDTIAGLSPLERRMIELHYFCGLPLSVTAKQLTYSVTYIQTLKDSCLFDLNDVCAGVYNDVCVWRKMDSRERIESASERS